MLAPPRRARLEDEGPRTIAKDEGGLAPRPTALRGRLRRHHERARKSRVLEETVENGDAVNEPGAGRAHVEREGARRAKELLHLRRELGDVSPLRPVREDDPIDRGRIHL